VRFFQTNHSQHVFNPKACQLSVTVDDKKVTSHFSCLFVMEWISVTQYLTVNCHITVPNRQSKFTSKLTSPVAVPLTVSTITGTKWLTIYIYILTAFPTGDAVATFQLMASYNYLAAHLYILLLYPSIVCVLCKESKYIMDQGHFPNCTVLCPGNTPSTVKLNWNDSRQMELLQVPKNKLLPPPILLPNPLLLLLQPLLLPQIV